MRIKENCNKIYSLALSSKSDQLFYGSIDHSIKVYDLEKKLVVNNLKGHSSDIWSLDLTSCGRYLVSGGSDCKIKIWDIENKYKNIHTLEHGTTVLTLKICPQNKKIFYAGARYQSIKHASLNNKLEKPALKTETILKKVPKKKYSLFRTKKKVDLEHRLPEHMLNNSHFIDLFGTYKEFLNSLPESSQESALAIVIKWSSESEKFKEMGDKFKRLTHSNQMLTAQNVELLGKEKEYLKSIRDMETKQSQISFDYQSIKRKRKDFGKEIIEMNKRNNVLIQEKKVLNINMDINEQELKKLRKETKLLKKSVLQLNSEKTSLVKELESLKRSLAFLKQEYKDKNVNLQISEEKVKFLKIKNKEIEEQLSELKNNLQTNSEDSEYYTKIIIKYQQEVTLLNNQLTSLKQNNLTLKENPDELYFEKLIDLLESDLFELKAEKRKVDEKNRILAREYYAMSREFNLLKQSFTHIVQEKISLEKHLNHEKAKSLNLIKEIQSFQSKMEVSQDTDKFATYEAQQSKKTLKIPKKEILLNSKTGSKKSFKTETLPVRRKKRSKSNMGYTRRVNIILRNGFGSENDSSFDHQASNENVRTILIRNSSVGGFSRIIN